MPCRWGSLTWLAPFAIWARGESYPDLIVNDIGPYDGATLLPDGSVALQVSADGTWSITKN